MFLDQKEQMFSKEILRTEKVMDDPEASNQDKERYHLALENKHRTRGKVARLVNKRADLVALIDGVQGQYARHSDPYDHFEN